MILVSETFKELALNSPAMPHEFYLFSIEVETLDSQESLLISLRKKYALILKAEDFNYWLSNYIKTYITSVDIKLLGTMKHYNVLPHGSFTLPGPCSIHVLYRSDE